MPHCGGHDTTGFHGAANVTTKLPGPHEATYNRASGQRHAIGVSALAAVSWTRSVTQHVAQVRIDAGVVRTRTSLIRVTLREHDRVSWLDPALQLLSKLAPRAAPSDAQGVSAQWKVPLDPSHQEPRRIRFLRSATFR